LVEDLKADSEGQPQGDEDQQENDETPTGQIGDMQLQVIVIRAQEA
jgi:hypothetical protein